MENLFNEIVKSDGIYFRGVSLGDSLSKVKEIEGTEFEENNNYNPHYKYYFEIGEMEEITIYYGFNNNEDIVNEIELLFISYPNFYWKKEGNNNVIDFFNLLQNNQLQPYSTIFLKTQNQLINHFTTVFKKEPIVEKKDTVFNQSYQNFSVCSWDIENEIRLSIMSYIDDSIDNNVKNFMKIWLRKY